MLRLTHEKLASELEGIHYSSSVTVTFGYDEKVRRSLPPGFGFLVPHSEGMRLLAATFVHNKFPHRSPENRALIRCFLGGLGFDVEKNCPVKTISSPGISVRGPRAANSCRPIVRPAWVTLRPNSCA